MKRQNKKKIKNTNVREKWKEKKEFWWNDREVHCGQQHGLTQFMLRIKQQLMPRN